MQKLKLITLTKQSLW